MKTDYLFRSCIVPDCQCAALGDSKHCAFHINRGDAVIQALLVNDLRYIIREVYEEAPWIIEDIIKSVDGAKEVLSFLNIENES